MQENLADYVADIKLYVDILQLKYSRSQIVILYWMELHLM